MPRGGRRPGAGRPKGSANKVTTAQREAFLATFHRLAPDLEGWIRRAAEENPAKAADLVVRMAEYHVPKQNRMELAGDGGGAVQIVVQKIGEGE